MKTHKVEIPKGYEIDKEKSTFENIVFKPINIKYVDLGLLSGTLWADTNEGGYYSYQDAIDTFGKNNLPKLSDYAELYDYCKWDWCEEKKGMVVTGPNSNSIFFPALGNYGYDDSTLYGDGIIGTYWSANTYGINTAYNLYFSHNGLVRPACFDRCKNKFPIRKIKRK